MKRVLITGAGSYVGTHVSGDSKKSPKNLRCKNST